jgi:glycerol kinase
MEYIAAIDQGTTSTRCLIFDHDGKIISSSCSSLFNFIRFTFQLYTVHF